MIIFGRILIFVKFLAIVYTYSIIPNLKLSCELPNNSFALSAYDRARTEECKEKIINDACYFETIKTLDYSHAYKQLDRKCPLTNDYSLKQHCVSKDSFASIMAKNFQFNQFNTTNEIAIHNENLCKKFCLTYYGHKYSVFLPFKNNTCICIQNLPQSLLAEYELNLFDCESDNLENLLIHETGHFDLFRVNYNYELHKNNLKMRNKEKCSLEKRTIFNFGFNNFEHCEKHSKKVNKIVFVFTVSLRTDRQILRLLKRLYRPIHFYYIHVDEGSIYLKKKLEIVVQELREKKNITNIAVSKWSMRAIWGGASLLRVHLKIMNDLIELKSNNTWNWDYFINLSESDYPVKNVEEFDEFLSQFENGENLIGFSSLYNPTDKLLRNQGTHFHFLECENRMWIIADRRLPIGIQIELANDWVLLHHTFIEYILKSNDEYLVYLKNFFNDTLMSAEIFYHTIIVNSPFCDKLVNIYIRDMNFQKDSGRSCQCDRNVIDWCGCSPNYYNGYDYGRLKSLRNTTIFLARKFDPIRNQKIINMLDQTLSQNEENKNLISLNSYWLNYYSVLEENENYDAFSNMHFNFKFFLSLFYEYSIELFYGLLLINSNNNENIIISDQLLNESIKLALNRKKPTMLQEVYSYFYEDDFKGFVMSFKLSNKHNLKFETYFKQNNEFIIQTINERYEWHDYKQCNPFSEQQAFYDLIETIEVSTDFENREMRCSNYAGIIDENSYPVLIINFHRNFNKNFTFYTQWFNPDGEFVDENFWYIRSGYYKYGNYVYVFLKRDPNKPIKTGIWSLKISFSSFYDKRRKLKLNNYGEEDNRVIIEYNFNVIPDEGSIEKINKNDLLKFWSFDSICMENSDLNYLADRIKICSQNSEWSSFYPDPKSNIMNLLS